MKKTYAFMIPSVAIGLVAFGILFAFFYRTAEMDVVGSIVAALLSLGVLALLIVAIVNVGVLFD